MGNTLFSIVIPTYNRAGFIQQTILGALRQDYPDFEVLVIDDGSTDNTAEVVSRIRDDRLKYLKKENAERGAARNYGCRMAGGDYINFLDSDDRIYPHHLRTAYEFISRQARPEIFHLGYDVRDKEDRLLRRNAHITSINRQIVSGNLLSCNGVFVRRDIMLENPFNEDRKLSSLEDWELWIRMASRYPFPHFDKITSTIVQHEERSVMTVNLEAIRQKNTQFIRTVFADEKNLATFGKELRKASASIRTYTSLHLSMGGGSAREVWQYLRDGIRDSPGEILKKRFLVILRNLLRKII